MNTLSYTIDSMNTHVEQATIEQISIKLSALKVEMTLKGFIISDVYFFLPIFSILLY